MKTNVARCISVPAAGQAGLLGGWLGQSLAVFPRHWTGLGDGLNMERLRPVYKDHASAQKRPALAKVACPFQAVIHFHCCALWCFILKYYIQILYIIFFLFIFFRFMISSIRLVHIYYVSNIVVSNRDIPNLIKNCCCFLASFPWIIFT